MLFSTLFQASCELWAKVSALEEAIIYEGNEINPEKKQMRRIMCSDFQFYLRLLFTIDFIKLDFSSNRHYHVHTQSKQIRYLDTAIQKYIFFTLF